MIVLAIAATRAAAQELSVDFKPLANSPRDGAPRSFDVEFVWRRKELLEGGA